MQNLVRYGIVSHTSSSISSIHLLSNCSFLGRRLSFADDKLVSSPILLNRPVCSRNVLYGTRLCILLASTRTAASLSSTELFPTEFCLASYRTTPWCPPIIFDLIRSAAIIVPTNCLATLHIAIWWRNGGSDGDHS